METTTTKAERECVIQFVGLVLGGVCLWFVGRRLISKTRGVYKINFLNPERVFFSFWT